MPTKTRAKQRRAAETPARLRARLKTIIARLEQAYPDATCALDHRNPLELLVATILSAQSTDARVNMVTPALFTKYPVKIERDLMALVPRAKWTWFSHTLIQHGRRVCIARRPKCVECVVNRWCPSSRV